MQKKTADVSGFCAKVLVAGFAVASLPVQAVEVDGVELIGYMRGGAYASQTGTPRGAYTLGGDAQKLRLGNEGDNYIEVGVSKTLDVGNNLKLSALYMPSALNGQYSTAQAYVAVSGFNFAPDARLWAGQRYLRIQDVHIVDRYFMDYGDNIGAGMTDYTVGSARLAVGVFTGGTFNNNETMVNHALRINADLSDIQVNTGGTLRLLATWVRGNFQMGSQGAGLSLSHNQLDFLVHDLTNTVFLQSATGHAGVGGQFQGLGGVSGEQPGLNSLRATEAVNWQSGPFGGQALISYQRATIDGGASDGRATGDFTLGVRTSYALSKHFKWLAEVGTTSRSIDGQARQHLNKFTIAPTLAMQPEFWSRPELRFYLTYVSWNGAAAAANPLFGAGGRSTLAGIQMESWW